MTAPAQDQHGQTGELSRHASALMSQQVWCWGHDILRPEGNWLVESGFARIEPPADIEKCSSVYNLELPSGRRVVLRGFGVFYGDDRLGGVFVPRYEFRPQYTPHTALERPPWTLAEMPTLQTPTAGQRDACASLTLDLIDWIRDYEVTIAQRLGAAYRQSTLAKWDDGERTVVAAEEMPGAWRSLGLAAAGNFPALLAQR